MKWNSELASVLRAEKIFGYGKYGLTFAALISSDVVLSLKVVKGEDVLHLSISVNNGAFTVLLAGLDLLDEEVLDIIRLLVGKKSGQILKRKFGISNRSTIEEYAFQAQGKKFTSKSSRILCFLRYSSASLSTSLSTSLRAREFICLA